MVLQYGNSDKSQRRYSGKIYDFLHPSKYGGVRYFFAIALLLSPGLALASCTKDGSTVVYINGIFTTLDHARQDLENLQGFYKDKSVNFINGYNPSHLAGAG